MTRQALARRVQALEQARQPATAGPGYVSFRDDDALRAYLAQPGRGPRLTAYVTCGPDDWDGEP